MRRTIEKCNDELIEATKHWKFIAPVLAYPKNERDYDLLLSRLDKLLVIVGSDENHPLIGFIDALSNLISSYDDAHFQQPNKTGINALKYLMESHHLTQSDLPEIGSQGVVSEILNGKRQLNLRQVRLLSRRFHVSVATFL